MSRKIDKSKSLAVRVPEVAAWWHPTKNGDLTPWDVTCGMHDNVWWFLPYDDPETGKHFEFEWEARISNMATRKTCPILTNKKLWPGYNDLATKNPALAAQWHPTLNGDKTPQDVKPNSKDDVWWLYPYDDPRIGIHYDFFWKEQVYVRNRHPGCPVFSSQRVCVGFNDLFTVYPEIAAQWHPTKNNGKIPQQVPAHASDKIWWYKEFISPVTGEKIPYSWEASVNERARGKGDPVSAGKEVLVGYNDLATVNPELAAQWHPTLNGDLTPQDVTAHKQKEVYWQAWYKNPRTGEPEKHEWAARIDSRSDGRRSPKLKMSKGEERTIKYLEKHDLPYEYEAKFPDLRGVGDGLLSYDFYLKGKDILIEFQGAQHYRPIEARGGKERFKVQKKHDKRKRKYAKKHGLPLIEIPEICDTQGKVNEYLDEHLLPLLS